MTPKTAEEVRATVQAIFILTVQTTIIARANSMAKAALITQIIQITIHTIRLRNSTTTLITLIIITTDTESHHAMVGSEHLPATLPQTPVNTKCLEKELGTLGEEMAGQVRGLLMAAGWLGVIMGWDVEGIRKQDRVLTHYIF